MERSSFGEYIDAAYKGIVTRLTRKFNGNDEEQPYLYKRFFTKQFSVDLNWKTLQQNNVAVAAAIVAMDSELPLYKRDAISDFTGEIPKSGMELYLTESQIKKLQILRALNNGDQTNAILQELFADVKKAIQGVQERQEYMALTAMSTGYGLVEDDKNVGLGVRFDFGHPKANKFGVGKKWSEDGAKPLTDIQNLKDNPAAKGKRLRYLITDPQTFNKMRRHEEVKSYFAFSQGFAGSAIPIPTRSQVTDFLRSEHDLEVILIDRYVTTERNGERTTRKPWADGVVVLADSLQFGRQIWGTSAEMDDRVDSVNYEVSDDFILVSKYKTVKPFREYTTSQAFALCVLDNVNGMFIMNTEEADDTPQTEGDANFDYEGTSYTRASVIAAINKANPEGAQAKESNADSTLQNKINALSDEQIEIFEANIVESA